MRCLGIAIKKNEICYSVVDGDKMDTALIYEIGRQNYRSESPSLKTIWRGRTPCRENKETKFVLKVF